MRGIKEKAGKGVLGALVGLLQQVLCSETGWTRSPDPVVQRWKDVYPLGSGPGKVFHLKAIDMVTKNIKLNNSGCLFQFRCKDGYCGLTVQ